MANQFTVKGEQKAKGEGKGNPVDGHELTPKQKRFFLNLAAKRFGSLRQCAIDAGYALTSASTVCAKMAKDYSEYIDGLRDAIWTQDVIEEAKRRARTAKIVLEELALSSANDNVRRLASRDLLELAGELKTVQDKPVDLSPSDLRQEAQRAAQAMQVHPMQDKIN